jgi:hypothetical protein
MHATAVSSQVYVNPTEKPLLLMTGAIMRNDAADEGAWPGQGMAARWGMQAGRAAQQVAAPWCHSCSWQPLSSPC